VEVFFWDTVYISLNATITGHCGRFNVY